ncbi:MAG: hypothetical protein U1C60_09340 [Rhodocyclaceae bacterium]|nr:hypothetical protein [Rhodocyclaceae bacterium]
MQNPDKPVTDSPKRGRPAGDTPPVSNRVRTQRARRKVEEDASRITELDPASVTDTVLLKALAVRLAKLRKPNTEHHDGARDVAAHIIKVLTDRYNLDKDDLA